MKSIKEYIENSFNEGLFDDEDDLLGKKTSSEILKWFDGYNNIMINRKALKLLDNGLVALIQKTPTVWHHPLPEYIKLDKDSWEKYATNTISFDIKSQKDLDGICGPIQDIYNNEYLYDLNIHTDSIISFGIDLKDIRNVTLVGDNDKFLKLGLYNNVNIKDPHKILQFDYKNIKYIHLIYAPLRDIFSNYIEYQNLLNELIKKGIVIITFYDENIYENVIATHMIKGTQRWNTNKLTKDPTKGEWIIFTNHPYKFISTLENYF